MIGTVLLGLGLGALGAVTQIRLTRWRAGLVARGAPRLAFGTLPLSLLGPAAVALACAALGGAALWGWLLGFAGSRWFVLRAEMLR